MRYRFSALLLASTIALVAACQSTGKQPVSPGPSSGGGTVPNPNPNPAPVTTPPPPPPTLPPPVEVAPPPAPGQPEPVAAPSASVPPPAPAPAAAVPSQPAAAPVLAAAPRPYQDVLKLKQAGLSDEFILNKVRTENVNYQLTTSEILELRAAGVSETVLAAMLRSGQPPAAMAGTAIARRAEFPGIALVGRGFLGIGTKTSNVGRLVVDGDRITWTGSDPDRNFSIYAKNLKEIFNTCVLRPGSNLCLEVGFVTFTGDEYRFREPGYKNGDNHTVIEMTNYFRQAFPNLFFSERPVSEL